MNPDTAAETCRPRDVAQEPNPGPRLAESQQPEMVQPDTSTASTAKPNTLVSPQIKGPTEAEQGYRHQSQAERRPRNSGRNLEPTHTLSVTVKTV